LVQLPVSCRISPELSKGYHWESSHRHIGILKDKKIETLQVSKCQEDLDRLLVETRGGDRSIESRDIDIPMDKGSGKSIVKTPAQSEPSIWGDKCQKSEESQDIQHQEIGVPEVEGIGTSEVSKSWRD
jgi:hypothetical protein